ncbi:AMSH-like protease [Neosynchiropus ocellatus]
MDTPFSLNTLKKMAAEPDYTDVSLPAVERVRALTKLSCRVDVCDEVTPRRYFRSGVEMERMAAVYMEEGSLENAYVLYNKFITLFVEKLPAHKHYRQCSVPEKHIIMKKLQEVAFPCKDELKKRLEEKYDKEHKAFLRGQVSNGVVAVNEQNQLLEVKGRLLAEERQRVAVLRQMQIESEQFRYFEDQLRRQELANRKAEEAEPPPNRPAPSQMKADSNMKRAPPTVSQAAASLAQIHAPVVSDAEVLRRVVVPRDLVQRFLRLAEVNTMRGVETCGVLCGRLQHDELVLTHLVVPKQTSGPDFCDMENVEELFNFQDQHNLLTVGWIHTHPTQTAFLSSVDLHTHCSYQLMLPEAVAIVCAPKHNDSTAFRLSASGMSEVSGCRLKGFHPHSKDPAPFMVCKHVEVRESKLVVLDLR